MALAWLLSVCAVAHDVVKPFVHLETVDMTFDSPPGYDSNKILKSQESTTEFSTRTGQFVAMNSSRLGAPRLG